MAKRSSLLLGISILWLPLSMLFDGLNSLILPVYLLELSPETNHASILGLMTFVALILGMFVQLVAAAYSDKFRWRWERRVLMGLGLLFLIPLLLLTEILSSLAILFLIYLLIQVAANMIQAALQALLPELIPVGERGLASGVKNLMDIGGALLVFMLLAQLFSMGMAHLVMPLIALVFVLAYLLSLVLVREPQQSPTTAPFKSTNLFHFDLQKHSSFGWLILTRFLFLLGTYAVGRFLLFFVASRLELDVNSAGEESATILGILTLITVLLAPMAGWLADRFNRRWLMAFGGLVSALAVLLLMTAYSTNQILLYGGLMAFGSAVFSSANWALTADYAPADESARFMALANFGTAGAAACAGIFGFLIDMGNQLGPEMGYSLLFIAAALAFLASSFAVQMVAAPLPIPDAIQAFERID